DCTDAGSTRPIGEQVIGRVLSTIGSAGNATVALSVSGASLPAISSQSGNFTITAAQSNTVFLVTAAASATLPALSAVPNGFNVTIKRTGAGAVTITPAGADTIDGATSEVLNSSYGYLQLVRSSSAL